MAAGVTGGRRTGADLGNQIDGVKSELDTLYEMRADQIIEAVVEGYSLRDIAQALGISHTAVAKAIKDM
jgi:DNA-directed RNA polymerase specialized sigma24 family protein